MAVMGLLIIAGTVIIIVFLVLRHHNHRSSLSVEQHAEYGIIKIAYRFYSLCLSYSLVLRIMAIS